MVNTQLENYLAQCQSKRIPFDQIEQGLIATGYAAKDIIDARNWYAQHPYASLASSNTPAASASFKLVRQPGSRTLAVGTSIVVAMLIFLSTAFYVVATEKVKLPNAKLQQQIRMAYYALPGVPKSPKIVLEQAADAHQKVVKNSFDLSLSIQGIANEIQKVIGAGSLDISLSGFVDYTDETNPKVNLSFLAGKDLDIEVRKKDAIIYVQVPKIPPYIYLVLNLQPDKLNPLLANWISFDTTPLETAASKKLADLKKEGSSQSLNQQTTQEIIKELLNEHVYPLLTMTSDMLDNQAVYKIQFKPTAAQLDVIGENMSKANAQSASPLPKNSPGSTYKPPKVSEYLKNIEILVYVGKKDSYVHRTDISFRVETSSLYGASAAYMPIPGVTNTANSIDVAMVLTLSEFGRDVPISIPDTALTQQEFYQKLMEMQPGGIFGSMNLYGEATASARNARRRADINSLVAAITVYNTDQGSLPLGITSQPKPISKKGVDLCSVFTPVYLVALPVDPSLNTIPITDCQTNYDTGYTIVKNSAGEIVLQAPHAENGESITVKRSF